MKISFKIKELVFNTRGYAYFVFSEVLSKGVMFIAVPFFVNMVSKEDFGKLSLYWVTVPLFSILLDFSQRSYVKYYFITNKTNTILLLRALNIYICTTFLFYLIVFGIKDLYNIYFIDRLSDYLILGTAALFALTEIKLSLFQIKGDFKRYSIFFIAKNAIPYIFGILLLFVFTPNIYYFMILQLAVYGFLVYFLNSKERIILFQKKKLFKILGASLKFSSPLIPAMLSALALSFSDRFVIDFYLGKEAVADYTIVYTVGSVFAAFFLATNKMWQKFILENLKLNNINQIRVGARKYLIIIVFLGSLLCLFREPLILLVSNSSYLLFSNLVFPIIVGMLFYFLYTLYSNIPFFYKHSHIQAIPSIIAATLNVILNIIFVPKYGIIAAAYTTALAYFVQFIILYLICVYKYNLDVLLNARKTKSSELN